MNKIISNKKFFFQGALSVGEIINCAIILYKNNFINVILYALIPGVITIVIKTYVKAWQYTFSMEIGTICEGFFNVVLFFVSLVFNLALAKAFFNILTNKKSGYFDIIKWINSSAREIYKLAALLFVEIIILILLELFLCVIIFIIYFFSGDLFKGIGDTSFLILYLSIFYSFATVLFFQIVVFATETKQIRLVFAKSLEYIFDNLVYTFKFFALNFILCLYAISCLIIPGICLMLLLHHYGLAFVPEDLIASSKLFGTVFSILCSIVFWPFVIAIIVMFCFSFRVKKEGIDLYLQLKNE
ncbi:MAG: hypothetical protein AB1782_16295 [Cyanobacteriota bacterium]